MLDELLEALVPDDAIEDCAALHAWMVKNPGAFETKAERSGVLVEMRMDVGICAVCREMIEAGLDDPGFRQRLAERSTASSYILRITARTDSGRDEAMDIVERLARKEVVEVAGTDTVSSAFVHVEALPGHTPYHSVLLGFDRPQGIGRQVIIENDATAQQWVLSFPHGAMEELVRLLPPGLIPATP